MSEQERYRGCVDEHGHAEWSALLFRWRLGDPCSVMLDQWDPVDSEWNDVVMLVCYYDPKTALLAAADKLEDLARHCATMAQAMREQSTTINARLEQRAQENPDDA